MPSSHSKSKKPTKAQSMSPSMASLDSEVSEEDVWFCLEEASRKNPNLIGKSALIARFTDVEPQPQSRGCKIWLSEPFMLSSSLAPSSLVSVSLCSSRKGFMNGFPLSSLADECASYYGVDSGEVANEAGNFFALATVFPSSKVSKNGVRMSLNLSQTMGGPISGRIVWIYPIQHQPASLINGNHKSPSTKLDYVSLQCCEELHLVLLPSKINDNTSSPVTVIAHDNSKKTKSPKTSMCYQSKISSSSEESVSSSPTKNGPSSYLSDVYGVLRDENSRKLLETYVASWLYSRSLLRGNMVVIQILSELYVFHVVAATTTKVLEDYNDKEYAAYEVRRKTKVYLNLPSPEIRRKDVKAKAGIEFPKLGGLSKEYAILKEIIISSSVNNTLSSVGLRTIKGVLLHGPPGTGKTALARICVNDAGISLFSINGPEITRQYHGESEQALHQVFESASRAAPAVVFIDELDAIAPARKDGSDELSQRMVATLLHLMDGIISTTDGLLVIAATNRPDNIEPALRRPGRFDREIEIGVPSPKQRLDILCTFLNEMEHSLSDSHVQQLAMTTHGFVGADLAALCTEAALVCLRRYKDFNNSSDAENVSTNGLKGEEECILKTFFKDFEKARMKVRPSAMREVIIEVPKVKWGDIGGQNEVKAQLMEAVEWPQKHQDALKRIGTRPPTGVLLFGPPGCSKTLMARAVASEAALNFLSVKGPELFSKWVGESEKAVSSLFAKARANAPSIIFFDEIDGLAVIRGKENNDGVSVSDRVMSQLLVELDGLHQRVDVIVIAATNRPDKIDSALLRPGRFDRLLYVGPPNENDREDIFRIHLRKMPCSSTVSTRELARLTQGCTGADILLICREAAVEAIDESPEASEVGREHFISAIRRAQPTEILSYEELSEKFQRLVHSDANYESGCPSADKQQRQQTTEKKYLGEAGSL